MKPILNPSRRVSRAARLTVVLAAIAALAGCKGLLDVTNTGAVDASQLSDIQYINILTNSVVGEYQRLADWDGVYEAKFSGEVVNHMTFFEELDIGYRNISDGGKILGNGTYVLAVYNPIHRVRWLADTVASRLKTWEGDSAGRDLRLARVLAYGAYAHTYLGEQICSSPINLSKPYQPSEIFSQFALPRYDEAIKVALAAKQWATTKAPDVNWTAASLARYAAGADSIANMARVGAARTALDLNDKAKAITYASAVTPVWASDKSPGFQMWAQFLADKITNRFYSLLTPSGSHELSLLKLPLGGVYDAASAKLVGGAVGDPRIPQAPMTAYDGTRNVPVPGSSPAFSTYDASVGGAPVDKGMGIRIASAIEARYILAEAQGKTGAGNIDFLNNRRALAGMAAVDASISDNAYRDALIEQRARDLFLDGHRLGDLRRYKQFYGLDLYPRGTYPTSTTIQYGSQECFPIPVGELQGNPLANQ